MRRIFSVLLLASTLAAPPALSQTLEEALALAYSTNPQIAAFRARLRATDERVAQARAGWRPTVTLSASAGKTFTDREDAPSFELSPRQSTLAITQPLYRGGRTVAGIERARNEIQADRARLLVQEQQVLLDAATAYMNVLREEAVLDLTVSNVQVLQRQLEATEDRFRVGEVTRTDVAQSESRLARATSDRLAAEGQLTISRATFQRVVGVPPQQLSVPALPARLPATAVDAASVAATDNFSVIAAKFDEAAARQVIDEVQGELLPTVSATAGASYTRETQLGARPTEQLQVAAQVSVPLYEAGSVYSRVRQAKQTASQRLIDIDTARRNVIEGSTQAFEALTSAQARMEALRAQIRASEIALEGVRQEATVGTRTVLDVLNAEQELSDAQVNLARAERDALVASFQLLSALGRMTAQSLALPVELYDFETNLRDVGNRWWGTAIRSND